MFVFFFYVHHHHMIHTRLGTFYYNLSIFCLTIQSFPVFMMFLVNILFIVTETSTLQIATEGIISPYFRLLSLKCSKIKSLFKDRLNVDSVWEFFFSINGPESRFFQVQKEAFYLTYENDQDCLEANV